MQKETLEKKRLKLNKETLRRLAQSELKAAAGAASAISGCPTCFPDICMEMESTGC